MFLEAREIFRVSPSKNYVLVSFLLKSTKESILDLLAVNNYVLWFLFRFCAEFKSKENPFRVNSVQCSL